MSGADGAEAAPVGREVGGDAGRTDGSEGGAESAAAAQGRESPERAERRPDPERPPVGAVGVGRLDPRLGAERAELTHQPLGGPSLPLGGRRPVDALQFLQSVPEPGLVGLADGRV